MKKIIIISLLITSAFANDRVNSVISEDANSRLTHIEEIKNNLSSAQKDLVAFEKSLVAASKTEGRENVFITIRNVAGISAAISLALTGTLLLKKGPQGEGRLYNLLLAYGGAAITGVTGLVALGGEVGVLLSKNDAEKLRRQINDLQTKLHAKNIELKSEIKLLCKDDPRHKLCY